MKLAVGTTARHEDKYIQEWICFYYLQGWDKIIVCINKNLNDPRHDNTSDMINQLPPEVLEKVSVLHINHEPGWGFQFKGYHHILDFVSDCEWLGFFDADEYLCDSRKRNIHQIMEGIPGDVGQILVPWVRFGHSNRVVSIPPQETRLAAFVNRMALLELEHVKPIVRTKNILIPSGHPQPSDEWYRCHWMKATGRQINFQLQTCDPINSNMRNVSNFDPCIAHYYTGSMEDWVNRYKNRHCFGSINPDWHYDVKDFTDYNFGVEDTRMSIYLDDLRQLLRKCG